MGEKINKPILPDEGTYGSVGIIIDDDIVSCIENGTIKINVPYTIGDNQIWVWEEDVKKIKNKLI